MQLHPSPSQEMVLMRISCVVLCLLGTAWAGNGSDVSEFSSLGATGRGPRVMENVHSDCNNQDWPFCSDDDWPDKCPSGCRMKGLIDETDQDFTNRISKLRNLLFEYQRSNKDSSSVTREMLELIRGDLVSGNENDNLFGQVSEDLRSRIETLKRKVSDQAQRIINLQSSVRDQLVEMKRLEVDIDIKVRSCKGSCNRAYQYEVDLEFYKQHQKMLEELSKINLLPTRDRQNLPILKMRPTKDFLPGNFKSQLQKAPAEWAALESMKQVEMVLENPGRERGSSPDSSSYGTGTGAASSGHPSARPDSSRYPDVEPWDSKPGNPSWGHTRWEGSSRETAGSTSFGSGSTHSSKLFTSGSGKEFPVGSKDTPGLFTTKRRSCSKTVTKTIVNGPDGPKEVTKEVLTSDDGSDCSDMPDVGFDLGGGSIFSSRGTSDGAFEGRGDVNTRLTDGLSFFDPGATGTRYQGPSTGRGDSKFGTQHSFSQKSESDTFMEHGDDETEDFSHFGTPDFTPSKTQGVTSTKTVVSSSSTFSRDGSTFETKSYKEAEVEGGRKTTSESLNVRSSKTLRQSRGISQPL
ncbi:fibrinogen alpha chain-like [Tachyglossus aculeatus]|uniref:fibrinogen alpha chain-like n=1 Tax=Tachyglossus aculeatus TaxID=9261 RepID=UPI0018F66D25|nr:fibrinogen alpha chain-like [Tachyglossus aculeatus]